MRKAKRASVVADALSPAAEAQVVKVVRQDWDNAGRALRGETAGFLNRAATGAPAPSVADPDALTIMARDIVHSRRKVGGQGTIIKVLEDLVVRAQYEARRSVEEAHENTVKHIDEAHREQILCGFMAQMQDGMVDPRGQPEVIRLPRHLLETIYHALGEAGYTAKGRR